MGSPVVRQWSLYLRDGCSTQPDPIGSSSNRFVAAETQGRRRLQSRPHRPGDIAGSIPALSTYKRVRSGGIWTPASHNQTGAALGSYTSEALAAARGDGDGWFSSNAGLLSNVDLCSVDAF